MTFNRILELKQEMGLSTKDVNEKIVDIIKSNNLNMDASRTPRTWQQGCAPSHNSYCPPVGALICFSNIFNTNIDYLLGRHDVRSLTNETVKINIRYDDFKEEYARWHYGRSPITDKLIYTQWLNNIQNGVTPYDKIQVGPFIRISNATGLTIDYILGLSAEKFWQTYCLNKSLFEQLPTGTLLLTDDGAIWRFDRKLLTVTSVFGDSENISDILPLNPKVVRNIDTF